jgi:hypothetical protein
MRDGIGSDRASCSRTSRAAESRPSGHAGIISTQPSGISTLGGGSPAANVLLVICLRLQNRAIQRARLAGRKSLLPAQLSIQRSQGLIHAPVDLRQAWIARRLREDRIYVGVVIIDL